MIKLTYSQMNSPKFTQAIREILNQPFEIKLAYDLKKIGDALNQAKRRLAKEYESEIVEKFCERDAEGKLVFDKDHEGFKISDEHRETCGKAEIEFLRREVTIDREKLSLSRFAERHDIKLSAESLNALEPLIMDDLSSTEGAASGAV